MKQFFIQSDEDDEVPPTKTKKRKRLVSDEIDVSEEGPEEQHASIRAEKRARRLNFSSDDGDEIEEKQRRTAVAKETKKKLIQLRGMNRHKRQERVLSKLCETTEPDPMEESSVDR